MSNTPVSYTHLLRRWLDDGMLLPAGELAEMAENIMMRGLSFLQEER